MAAGGVRTHVSHLAQPPRLVKKRVKAFESFKAAQAAGEPTPPPVLIDPTMQESAPDSDPIAATVPAGSSMAGDFLDQVPDAPLPPPPPPAAAGEPTDGVAPPIDWNQPFG